MTGADGSTAHGGMGARRFWSELPSPGRWLLLLVVVQTLGRGMILPFTIIYANEVRGIDIETAGLLIALVGLVAFISTGPGGALLDRFGARTVLIGASGAHLLGCVVLAFATTVPAFTLGFVLLGINVGWAWTALSTFIGSITTGALRQQFYGVQFAVVNLGVGLGGTLAGLIVDVSRPRTFTTIFLLDAACMLLVVLFLLFGPLRRIRTQGERIADVAKVGYLQLLRRPAVIWLALIGVISSFIGYGQFEAGIPLFARRVGEVSTLSISIGFAVNTGLIVLFQFTVGKRLIGHRRTAVMLVMSALWIVAWLVFGASGFVAGSILSAAAMWVFFGVFAAGEVLLQTTEPAIVNDIADDRNRGRSNAIQTAAFNLGAVLGPLVAGFLLDRELYATFIAVMIGMLVVLMLATLALSNHLTPSENGLGATEPV